MNRIDKISTPRVLPGNAVEAPAGVQTSQALVPVNRPAAASLVVRRPLGNAPFLAQLCAHALGEAQTRARRRATPQEARAAYAQPGQIVSRYLKSA